MSGAEGESAALAGNGAGSSSDPPMFRGVTALNLDAKGRLAIPTRYRDVLATNLVLTADPSRCLLLYPRAAWEPLQARLMSMSSFDPKIRALQRLLVGHGFRAGGDQIQQFVDLA